ncbi:MAG: formylglycine-generating enzyme family protein, partial [Chloroflexi bacterium]|nr:formylglycine-generating enzyme family protein [Chloroflexota bacterium]
VMVENEDMIVETPPMHREKRERVQAWQLAIVTQGALAPRDRALAGRMLSQLGDTRPGVGVIERADGQKLPDIVWGKEILPDRYPYQEETIEIKHAYQVARYPVTYAQFQCFIDAADFDEEAWWAGMPKIVEDVFDNEYPVREMLPQAFPYTNHPRENVSWYQAVAFCRWLSAKLDLAIRLPHEHEWEVAARYPDGRSYPWGNEWDSNNANTDESGIGQTTAVGVYSNGRQTELDLYDLSGNVWEWCQNKYEDPSDDKVDDSENWRALRGGSWIFNASFARAANRLDFTPANRYFYRRFSGGGGGASFSISSIDHWSLVGWVQR